jgi:hypothetical protein
MGLGPKCIWDLSDLVPSVLGTCGAWYQVDLGPVWPGFKWIRDLWTWFQVESGPE